MLHGLGLADCLDHLAARQLAGHAFDDQSIGVVGRPDRLDHGRRGFLHGRLLASDVDGQLVGFGFGVELGDPGCGDAGTKLVLEDLRQRGMQAIELGHVGLDLGLGRLDPDRLPGGCRLLRPELPFRQVDLAAILGHGPYPDRLPRLEPARVEIERVTEHGRPSVANFDHSARVFTSVPVSSVPSTFDRVSIRTRPRP